MDKRLAAVLVAPMLMLGMTPSAVAAPAVHAARSVPSTGYDISYPQCPSNFPASPAFGIVGVNDGLVYSANPCLAGEYAWAAKPSSTIQTRVQFYANTGNPGPSSGKWPTGQTLPQACDGTASTGCYYDYGWNAAADSFNHAVTAAGSSAAATAPWWLDVESANSWSTAPGRNVADLGGALDYLKSSTSATVGFYTNASSWASITGSTTAFAAAPSWVPGARTLRGAQANCTASITGGRVRYAQYPSGGYDADYACF